MLAVFAKFVFKFFESGIVARRQRAKGYFVKAGAVHHLFCDLRATLCATLSNGAIPKSCLTESATACATAIKFERGSVVNRLYVGNERTSGIFGVFKVLHYGFYDLFALFMQRRNVRAFHTLDFFKDFRFRKPLFSAFGDDFEYRNIRVFALADENYVEKVRKRFGIDRARSACEQNGIGIVAVFGSERNLRQIQHIQNVGVQKFESNRKAYDGKIFERLFGFERQ